MPVEPVKHKVRGIEVRMLRGGSGPPLLFLHGANGLTPWLPFFENLSKKFEVLVPEHPGFGSSDNPPWIRNVGDLAMYYLDFIDGLGAGKVHLVGQSLGGWTAAEVAVRNDTKLASLSLFAPAGIRVKGVPTADNFIWGPEEFNDDQNDVALTNRYAATKFGWEPRWFNPALERWLHRISVSTLVLWGAHDKLFPAAYAARWGERIPGSRVEVLPDCGHAINIEKAAASADAVIRLAGRP
jgi:pimeloyl-ACP methyl ester carboxylesterase